MNNTDPILEVRNVSKSFSGIKALKNLDLKIFPGEVLAVTGENGAGKSTLMKIISGVYREFSGKIIYNNEERYFTGPRDAADMGVTIIHQELSLIPGMTVAENIFLGREPVNRTGLIDYRRMNSKTMELLEMLHLQVNPSALVRDLKVGQQQLVEIARALLFDSRVLIMDEPTSAISDKEVELLFQIISKLKAGGVAVVYISHKMKEIFAIADSYAVLRDGELIGTGRIPDITPEQLIQMMVGRKITGKLNRELKTNTRELLKVEDLCLSHPLTGKMRVHNVSFTLHEGEVLGICGLMGSGRTEILEAVFGLWPNNISGRIIIKGRLKKIRNISDAISEGIALVPEDRKLQGLILNMAVAPNTSLASLKKISPFGFIDSEKEEMLSNEYIKRMNTQVPSSYTEVQKLSGGNQQKVVISKWLATKPVILLLDEPTRGIDVGAKAEIYALIEQLAGKGMGIIIVSSELPEILAVSDTILVMSDSKPAAILQGNEATEKIIMKAALIKNTIPQ